MRILIVSDVWKPTVNGLCTILGQLASRLRRQGHSVYILYPGMFARVRCPWYPDVHLALNLWQMGTFISAWKPNCLHIASEGPMGLAARRWATARKLPVTTAIHTRMDIHLSVNLGIPASWVNSYMRWFHSASDSVLVHSQQQKEELEAQGYNNLELWSQGVNHDLFRPLPPGKELGDYLLFVGRISSEKEIERFLQTPTQLRKVVVGDGPRLPWLKKHFPEVEFTGLLRGQALAEVYARARAFVMPSRSETLGIVMLEALASGVPVAAYPVIGPIGVIENGVNGWLDEDLAVAIAKALLVDRNRCCQEAMWRSWDQTTEQFLASLNRAPHIYWNGRGVKMQPSMQP